MSSPTILRFGHFAEASSFYKVSSGDRVGSRPYLEVG
jgi:hypothetical protein